jgi:hypothetical protein
LACADRRAVSHLAMILRLAGPFVSNNFETEYQYSPIIFRTSNFEVDVLKDAIKYVI